MLESVPVSSWVVGAVGLLVLATSPDLRGLLAKLRKFLPKFSFAPDPVAAYKVLKDAFSNQKMPPAKAAVVKDALTTIWIHLEPQVDGPVAVHSWAVNVPIVKEGGDK